MQLNKLGQEQLDFWIRALEGEVADQEWRAYFRHYKACLHLPDILIYKVTRNNETFSKNQKLHLLRSSLFVKGNSILMFFFKKSGGSTWTIQTS